MAISCCLRVCLLQLLGVFCHLYLLLLHCESFLPTLFIASGERHLLILILSFNSVVLVNQKY